MTIIISGVIVFFFPLSAENQLGAAILQQPVDACSTIEAKKRPGDNGPLRDFNPAGQERPGRGECCVPRAAKPVLLKRPT
jgi:hypothetical protein